MKISYNIDHLPERGRPYAAKSEETLALIAFLADPERKNMVIDYDDEKDAKRRYDTLRNFRLTNKLVETFDLYRPLTNRAQIVIIKTKKPGSLTPAKGGPVPGRKPRQ